MLRRGVALVSLVVLTACGSVPRSSEISAAHQSALADTITGAVKSYVAGWSEITCENQDAVLRFFDYSDPGFTDAYETEVVHFAGDSLPRVIRAGACAQSEVARMDSLIVRVLTQDVVTASWTYRTTYRAKDNSEKSVRGTVLQVFRRSPAGWKFPVAMSTHVPVASR